MAARRAAPTPVFVYIQIGWNDIHQQVEAEQSSPEKAAEDTAELLRRIGDIVGPGGGKIIQISYEEISGLPAHSISFLGKTRKSKPKEDVRMRTFHELLPPSNGTYRLVDVRGWLGDTLWTEDGIHLTYDNHQAQARLIWQRVLADELGCAAFP